MWGCKGYSPPMTRSEGESPGGAGFEAAPARLAAMRWAPLVVCAAGVLVYLGSLRGAFVYDDLLNIVGNPYLSPLFPPTGWLWAPPGFGLAGRPVASFSFALNHAVGGLDPLGYHLTNLAIHLAAALLLLGVVRRATALAGASPRQAGALALATALLFVVHPLTTGAVTYLYQRCESLMGALLLATVYCGLRARSASGGAAPRWARLAVVACWLGVGCKETMVVAPLLMLLFDRTLVAGTFRGALRAAPGLYGGLFASWALIAVLVMSSGARSDSVGFGFELDSWGYLQAQAAGLVHYVRLALWPTELVFDYGEPLPTRASQWLPQGLAVLAALGVTLVGLVRNRPLALVGAWFFLILGPSSSVLPIVTEIWVEHRMYLPLAAVVLGVVLALVRTVGTGVPLAVLVAAAAVALGWRTHLRQADYASEVELWRVNVEQTPENARAHYALGDALRRTAGDTAARREALTHMERAVELDPEDPFLRVNPGVLALELGEPERALRHLEAAVRLRPEWALAHQNLGSALLALGSLDAARGAFERSLELSPSNLDAARGLAMTHARARRPREARRLFEVLVRERPEDLEALVEFAELLLDAESVRDPARALQLARAAAARSEAPRVRALLERATEATSP